MNLLKAQVTYTILFCTARAALLCGTSGCGGLESDALAAADRRIGHVEPTGFDHVEGAARDGAVGARDAIIGAGTKGRGPVKGVLGAYHQTGARHVVVWASPMITLCDPW